MRKNNNTIEINGQLYDAHTGKLVGAATPEPIKPEDKPAIHSVKHVRQADRHAAKHSSPRAPSPPKTLMRHAVKKPNPSLKRQHPARGEISALLPEPPDELAIGSLARLDEKRLRRAKQIQRSRFISHFPAVLSAPASHSGEPPISLPKRPVHHAGARQPAHPRPRHVSPKEEMLNRAIERSTSHLQPAPHRQRHSKLKTRASMGAAAVLSVALLAVIVVQNQDGVRLQMASAKAGFDVSLPDYRPAGFALGQVNYSDGSAAEQFNGPGGGHYTITQKKSSWDSQALLKNFVAADYSGYQTVAAAGRTVYLYGDHNATWVYGGVWYVIQADGSISDQQLVDLAASL